MSNTISGIQVVDPALEPPTEPDLGPSPANRYLNPRQRRQLS